MEGLGRQLSSLMLMCLLINVVHATLPFMVNPECPYVPNNCSRLCLPAAAARSRHSVAVAAQTSPTIASIVAADVGAPLVLVADADIYLQWTGRCDGDTPAVLLHAHNATAAVAVVVSAVWRFDDASDSGELQSAAAVERVDTSHLRWSEPIVSPDQSSVRLCTNGEGDNRQAKLLGPSGTLCFKVWHSSDAQRDEIPPRLLIPPRSAHFEVELDKISDHRLGPTTRFAIELTAISHFVNAAANASAARLEQISSINDQYSPGVFNTINVKFGSDSDQAYLQWKPVVYKKPSRQRTDLTQSGHGPFHSQVDFGGANSTAYLPDMIVDFFERASNVSGRDFVVARVNVTFGYPSDGFYAATGYNVWVSSVGIGRPPRDSISAGLLALMVAALSVAAACALLAVTAVLVLRHRRKVLVRRARRHDDTSALVADDAQ